MCRPILCYPLVAAAVTFNSFVLKIVSFYTTVYNVISIIDIVCIGSALKFHLHLKLHSKGLRVSNGVIVPTSERCPPIKFVV